MTRQGLLLPSKLGHILAEIPEPLHYEAPMGTFLPYKGRFYCWTVISESGEIRLTEEMMKFLRLKPQMQLLSIRSSDIAFTILDELSRLATHYGFIDGGRMVKEMSAEELEMRCRKCVRAEVSTASILARVLDGMGASYRVVDNSKVDIYGDIPITKLVRALEQENCALYSVKERDESLESFYMNLIGGAHHA